MRLITATHLPESQTSEFLLVLLAREHTAIFRFLLEAYDNLAYFTVLERKTALLKLIFSPHQRANALAALDEIAKSVPLRVLPWPFTRGTCL